VVDSRLLIYRDSILGLEETELISGPLLLPRLIERKESHIHKKEKKRK